MKLVILLSCVVITLTGCEKTYNEDTEKFLLPPELADCKSWYLSNSSGNGIRVFRCPAAETTTTNYRTNKSNSVSVVIDGVEYVKKDKP